MSVRGPTVPVMAPRPVQTTLDELGTPLAEVTFVVVDLETTGGSPADCGITEVGAVKVRGGEVLGEFHSLVNPGEPIPPFGAVLTGIDDAAVAAAPRGEGVLPAFLEFAAGAVLVAHNAGFDVGFLKAACARAERAWPGFPVVDTVRLARHVLTKEEARDVKLSTLARLFRAGTQPDHRALHDARATVDVLHGLMERVGNLGVHSLEELTTYTSRVPETTRRKRHLAEGLPSAPGVYVFRDHSGRPLYVGTSVDIRTRVRTYFTAAEQRTRMAEMVAVATSVDAVVCATPLEARVRELRLIAELSPRYNRRSRFPERAPWVKLTVEPFPRLSVVREVRDDVTDGAVYVGPFGSTQQAELAVAALHETHPVRQCTKRLPKRASPTASTCLLADIGRCGAPCVGRQPVEDYAVVVDAVRAAMTGDVRGVLETLLARASTLAGQQRFEEAAVTRDRLLAFARGAARSQRLAPLAATRELVAALRTARGGWELVLVRHGRLAATTTSPPGADPRPYVDAMRSSGEHVRPRPAPLPAAHPEETEQVLRWLEQPGVRIVDLDGEWASPIHGAGAARARLDPMAAARSWTPPFGEPRDWSRAAPSPEREAATLGRSAAVGRPARRGRPSDRRPA
ncbi:MAG: DEDD exonuclease domain-containing protein [Actinobacteria bacterium]|nr:DEDD exonuclease domain-containing protein [Actinomycetota bacterium]